MEGKASQIGGQGREKTSEGQQRVKLPTGGGTISIFKLRRPDFLESGSLGVLDGVRPPWKFTRLGRQRPKQDWGFLFWTSHVMSFSCLLIFL
jgi:hypothetical protein